jgi:hypothetical protein
LSAAGIDREPVVTALLDQVPGEDTDRLAPETLPVPRRRQVQVDAGAAVHRVLDLAVLHGPDDLVVDLDHERLLVRDELFHLAFLQDPPPTLDLGFATDRGQAGGVVETGATERDARPAEDHRPTA